MKKTTHDIVVIPGDGIGPEVVAAMQQVVAASGVAIRWHSHSCGAAVLAATGDLIPQSLFDAINTYKYAIKGPITTPVGRGFRSANVTLRQHFDLFANIRPIVDYSGQHPIDMVIFRENSEDLYMGREMVISDDEVHAIKVITRAASERIARAAYDYAQHKGRQRVSAVHKANIMKKADGLFLSSVQAVARQYPAIDSDDYIVDNMCMQLVMRPEAFDVIVTENMYGDILSDLCAGLVGGLGLLPGINTNGDIYIFEAVHGSAPDIAGQGIANPIALILSAVELLNVLGETTAAQRVLNAVVSVIRQGVVATRDMGGAASTAQMTAAIIATMEARDDNG